MTLSRQLVRAMASISFDVIPDAIRDKARVHIKDAIGVGLAAAGSEVGKPYLGYAALLRSSGRSTVLTGSRKVDAADAAMINGGLIHSLEYDDTHTGSIIHGSSVLLPAALALAEEMDLSGREFVALYTCGYEALIRLGLASAGTFQRRGFQVTAVAGAPVVAAMAARAYGLDEDRSVFAVGIALSQASASMEFLSNGSSVKSLHPGWAAHSGIVAARLARAGLSGPETAIEGRFGLYSLFSGNADDANAIDFATIGSVWHLRNVAIKFVPACHYLHAFVECAEDLCKQGVTSDNMRRITCFVPEGAADVICEPWELKQDPPSGHAVRWSLPVIVAHTLLHGKPDLAAFERLPSAQELALAQCMSWQPLIGTAFPERFDARLSCEMHDGTVVEAAVPDAFGNASRPAPPADHARKFNANSRRRLSETTASELECMLNRVEHCVSVVLPI